MKRKYLFSTRRSLIGQNIFTEIASEDFWKEISWVLFARKRERSYANSENRARYEGDLNRANQRRIVRDHFCPLGERNRDVMRRGIAKNLLSGKMRLFERKWLPEAAEVLDRNDVADALPMLNLKRPWPFV